MNQACSLVGAEPASDPGHITSHILAARKRVLGEYTSSFIDSSCITKYGLCISEGGLFPGPNWREDQVLGKRLIDMFQIWLLARRSSNVFSST